jgi:iron complex transport system substrate-binding protein
MEDIMKNIAKIVTVSFVVAVMLAGCSNADEGNKESGKETEQTTAAKETKPAEQKESAESVTAETGKKQAEITYPYTYIDAADREVVLDKEPEKVSISYLPHWETLMMLGVMPVAATSAEHYASTWDAFKDIDLSSVKDLGTTEVNLELLAEIEPDIIFEQAQNVEDVNVENLEKIAPVVVFGPQVKMDWRYSLREIAKVVNKESKAEEVIAEVEGKLADARTKLQEKYAGQTTMLMTIMGEDKYYCAYRADLYDDKTGLGLVTPEGFTTSENYEQVSMEALVAMNPDYLFVNVFDGDEAIFEELSNNSVWNSLSAVKNGHVYRLDGTGHAASAMSTVYTVDFMIETLLGE